MVNAGMDGIPFREGGEIFKGGGGGGGGGKSANP